MNSPEPGMSEPPAKESPTPEQQKDWKKLVQVVPNESRNWSDREKIEAYKSMLQEHLEKIQRPLSEHMFTMMKSSLRRTLPFENSNEGEGFVKTMNGIYNDFETSPRQKVEQFLEVISSFLAKGGDTPSE